MSTEIQRPDWAQLKAAAVGVAENLGDKYRDKLSYEIGEIEKQGLQGYWTSLIASDKKFNHNKYGLVLSYILGITSIDPIASGIRHDIQYKADFPDVDVDFMPLAKKPIKEYAASKYGKDRVCSVGLWITYKPRLALVDAARALKLDVASVERVTKNLPDAFDKLGLDEARDSYPEFDQFVENNSDLVNMAYRLVGLIKAPGRHAGGLVISSVPVQQHLPLRRIDKEWTTIWGEGNHPQLSKFGFVKFDCLGVKTLLYLYNARKSVERNHNIQIEWTDIDPEEDRAGWIRSNGDRHAIKLDDEGVLELARQVKTESIFQYDTDFAMNVLRKGQPRKFIDIVVFSALGRPGPLPELDTYIARRDGLENWEAGEDDRIVDILKDTYGVICWQEELTMMWTDLFAFSKPEAEKARKIISKKWVDKLIEVENKVIERGARTIGKTATSQWWDKMKSFGRYCFNKSHGLAYGLVTHRCLWFKAYFPSEWWAAVLSDCHPKKLERYISASRREGMKFGTFDITRLTWNFESDGTTIRPGLALVKGIGEKSSTSIINQDLSQISDIDHVMRHMQEAGDKPNRTFMERMIKLGAFDNHHKNRLALWLYYEFYYGKNDDSRVIRNTIIKTLSPSEKQIVAERKQLADAYFKQYPRRKKIPNKIAKWRPKIKPSLDDIIRIARSDFNPEQKLSFEREFFGFVWSQPQMFYKMDKRYSIEAAKHMGILEAMIERSTLRMREGRHYMIMDVTDGISSSRVNIWPDELDAIDHDGLKSGDGIKIIVRWSDNRQRFNLQRRSSIKRLKILK